MPKSWSVGDLQRVSNRALIDKNVVIEKAIKINIVASVFAPFYTTRFQTSIIVYDSHYSKV